MTPIRPVGPATGQAAPVQGTAQGAAFGAAFKQALTEPLRLSAHAAERLRQAGLSLSPEDLRSAEAAVGAAGAKGSQTALVLLGSLALVVSVPNRTVVTAIDGARMGQGVFTGIDSAVIARGPVPERGAPGPLNDRGGPTTAQPIGQGVLDRTGSAGAIAKSREDTKA
jgi:flagellar operon protein